MTPVGLANSKLGSTIRVMGSLGSPFSADPADPGVGKGRQGSRFRYDHYSGFPNRNFATENNPNDYFLPEEMNE